MELIRGQHAIRPRHHGCVATIGNFDGVHLGHQAILRQVTGHAASLGLPALVITFEPQPQEFFAPATAPARLTRLRDKLAALEQAGVERVLCLRFDRRLASQPAETFIRDVLVTGLGVRQLVVGDDFRFGQGRRGDFPMLAAAGQAHGFGVEHTHTHLLDGERVSSTWVRETLARGELTLAARLLGRSYAISGRVTHGDKLGRSIGFPTANIHLRRRSPPLAGVFLVRAHGLGETPWPGMANVGRRPTVNGVSDRLEMHLLDYQGDLYGRHLRVEFLERLRPERRFESLAALGEQLQQDALAARTFFNTPAGGRRHG